MSNEWVSEWVNEWVKVNDDNCHVQKILTELEFSELGMQHMIFPRKISDFALLSAKFWHASSSFNFGLK